jgi:hypothetical protein
LLLRQVPFKIIIAKISRLLFHAPEYINSIN